jgi:hypothetical protein
MSGDYDLSDLQADASAEPESGGESGESGDSFLKALQYIDSRVGLDRLAAAQGIIPEQAVESAGDVPATDGSGDAERPPLTASSIAQFGKILLDQQGDVSISQVVKFAESHPDRVNQAIAQAVGDGPDGDGADGD